MFGSGRADVCGHVGCNRIPDVPRIGEGRARRYCFQSMDSRLDIPNGLP